MNQTNKIYGNLPLDIGKVDVHTQEMMFWLYCPIKLPNSNLVIPDNLKIFSGLIEKVKQDMGNLWYSKYVYLTAKTLFTNPENPGNRPGWHSDGFLSKDINYIWCDKNPTLFFYDGSLHPFTKDHTQSLVEMDKLCENKSNQYALPIKHLLKLDETVLHKIDQDIQPGIRTFVKISVSDYAYKKIGNSVNHQLTGTNWLSEERSPERNCPITHENL